MNSKQVYRIELAGSVAEAWLQWSGCVTRYCVRAGTQAQSARGTEPVDSAPTSKRAPTTTVVEIVVADQAALRGLLNHMWDLNLTVLSVGRVTRPTGARHLQGSEEIPGERGGEMFRESELRQLYLDRGADEARIENAVATAKRLVQFAGNDLSPVGVELIREYIANLIQSGENTFENLAALLRYAYVADLHDAYVYLAGVVVQHGVLRSIAERTDELAGPGARAAVFNNTELPPLGSPQSAYPAVVRQIVADLQSELGPELSRQVLAGNHHRIPEKNFESLRARYLEEGLDALLRFRRDKLLTELEEHARTGKPWYEQLITPEVVEFVRQHPEIGAGVRDGNTIYISKIPYDPVAYLETDDLLLKGYYQCHCPLARASIASGGQPVSPEFCYCSAGFTKLPLEVALGTPLEIEVLETVLGGDTRCRFAITIPDDTVL